MKKNVTFAGLAAAVICTGAYAAQPVGPYFGGLVGETKITDDIGVNEKEITWGAFAGFQFIPYLGAEVGYIKPQKIVYKDDEVQGADYLSLNASVWTLSGVATVPLGDTFSIHARAGVARVKGTATVVAGGIRGSTSDSTTDGIYGGGVGFIFEGARVRFEYQRVKHDGSKLGLLSASIVWYPVAAK